MVEDKILAINNLKAEIAKATEKEEARRKGEASGIIGEKEKSPSNEGARDNTKDIIILD
jgi:hypothetical protein